MPSKEAMIDAVRKSNCSNLKALPLEVMTAEQIYTHLLDARCPCLQKLLEHPKSSDERSVIYALVDLMREWSSKNKIIERHRWKTEYNRRTKKMEPAILSSKFAPLPNDFVEKAKPNLTPEQVEELDVDPMPHYWKTYLKKKWGSGEEARPLLGEAMADYRRQKGLSSSFAARGEDEETTDED
jgi:hypothetical protein